MPRLHIDSASFGYSLKLASLKTPFEEPAIQFAVTVAPWLKSALKPHYSGIAFENKYQLEAVKRLARPGVRCVDVGAHAGIFLRAFEKAAPGASHIAVEPVPWKAAKLKGKFPDAVVHQCAVSDTPGTARFTEIPRKSGTSTLSAYLPSGAKAGAGAIEYPVDVKTLDDIALDGPRVGLVKIDVEGAEGAVVLGASRIIERDRPALMFESGAPKHDKLGPADIFTLLRERFGYRLTAVRNFVFGDARIDDRAAFDYVRQFPATAFNFVAVPA